MTLKYVNRCPDSKESWENVADREDCSGMAYHCLNVLNINEHVSFCDVPQLIPGGYCPVYDSVQGTIHPISVPGCINTNPFNSTQAYKFPKCCREVDGKTPSSNKTDSTDITESCSEAILQGNNQNKTAILFPKNDHFHPPLPFYLTMNVVKSCPDSKGSWDQAAIRKGCEQISEKCSGLFEKGNLTYHCVSNPYQNETLEVCVPARTIFGGYCPEFSTLADKIQPNYDTNCSAHSLACPKIYVSTDAYKYQDCYNIHWKNKLEDTTTHFVDRTMTDLQSTIANDTNSDNPMIGFWIVLVLVLLIVLTIILIYWRLQKNRRTTASAVDGRGQFTRL